MVLSVPAVCALQLVGGLTFVLNPAQELARRIEEKHRSFTDIRARFVQTYRSGLLAREVIERGTVAVKPPGRMRWEYREPERKTFVSDGKTFYFYVPADRQVVVRDQAGDRGLLSRLLSGREGILSEFEVELDSTSAKIPRLMLTPKRADPDLDRLYIEPDRENRIRAIEILDAQGNRSQFLFEDIRENVGLPASLFRFEIPKGVEVITG